MPRTQQTPTFRTGADRVTRSQQGGRRRGAKLRRQSAAWAARSGPVVTYTTTSRPTELPLPAAANTATTRGRHDD